MEAVISGLKEADRGKLIMAPGTGKTYTSLAITEELAKEKSGVFRVLYLVPSIELLSQSLRGWSGDTRFKMDTIAVCSDRKVTKNAKGKDEFEDISAADLGYPATTNYEKLLEYKEKIDEYSNDAEILTVFSTYQSIDVVSEAQKNGFYEFDLVICDEAHRTTGSTEAGSEGSAFTKIHSNENIKAKKRLYQTATPRVYGDSAKQKASEMSVLIADMSDESLYGKELYRIGFGDAIRKGILTDYKVMVLAVDEQAIQQQFQQLFASKTNELEFDDVTKIIGCWNGLIKRQSRSNILAGDPMKRAIAFTGTIKESKMITDMFSKVVDHYLNETENQTEAFRVQIDHADGSMNALQKNEKISWLKGTVPQNTCRILSNARFLTEGVDVPDLDAVMFLKPRKSKIDIAQAVGRVMRKSPGKDYGYVILPIGIPAGVDENSILDNNEKYRVVWEVLNALRSLDERFDATINKLELNKKKPEQIQIIGVGGAPEGGAEGFEQQSGSQQLTLFSSDAWSDLEQAIYGKIVKKVGNVRYWEDWSKDVAKIAQQHISRIQVIVGNEGSEQQQAFEKFVKSLQNSINSSITSEQAIEMLAQHLITKPVFEALFDSYSFVNNNPVSKAMDKMIAILSEQGLEKEQEKLSEFYESVKTRADGIDNLKAKQDIIIQLYDKFFRTGFKETTERLGIVFTPTEVVDFIIHSTDEILKKHFGKSITDENVHILDPFTGTGTFIVRLLQSGIIQPEDLVRKYTQELHANEIVLLSYYIAAINIEETFHSLSGGEYKPFEGIVLTDTFESTEHDYSFEAELFNENNERLDKQKQNPIFAIMGNPPYSVGQKNANEDNQNISYDNLNQSIVNTYAKESNANLKRNLYDSYVLAYRWASNRIKEKGVISFVSNASFIDSNSFDGLRKCWHNEFNYIYVFNLRGNTRTAGEIARKEGGQTFGAGSRTPIAITFLIKDGSNNHEIYYRDIGDYLSREQKLSIIEEAKSIQGIEWQKVIPDENNDWINQRDKNYQNYLALDGEIFIDKSIGVSTNRDTWVYGFSSDDVKNKTAALIENYNFEVQRLEMISDEKEKKSKRNTSESYIKWSDGLTRKFLKNETIDKNNNIIKASYRPFVTKFLNYNVNIVDRPSRYKDFFGSDNKVIYVTGVGISKDFSALATKYIPNLHYMDTGQGFYLKNNSESTSLFEEKSNVTEKMKRKLQLSDEDIFHYVYAVMHSQEYRQKYAFDLNKSMPRIPVLENKEKWVQVGRKLVNLHIDYEQVPAYENIKIEYKEAVCSYRVEKMKFLKKDRKDVIIFNKDITITDIPEKAYDYVVNGKSAIEWIIDQYQVKVDKKSGITDDPNEYSEDPKYIFNLLLSIINVSVQTVDLVNSVPKMEIVE
ncbi:MAG: type ISP restriction/modification enzyme [Culicoidibacterales bacterium]